MSIRRDSRLGRPKWFRLFINEFLGRTMMLSPAALGAYVRLVCRIVHQQGPIPDRDRDLARAASMRLDEWHEVKPELAEVMTVTADGWTDDLAEDRIAYFRERSEVNSRNAARRYHVVAGGKLEEPDDE